MDHRNRVVRGGNRVADADEMRCDECLCHGHHRRRHIHDARPTPAILIMQRVVQLATPQLGDSLSFCPHRSYASAPVDRHLFIPACPVSARPRRLFPASSIITV